MKNCNDLWDFTVKARNKNEIKVLQLTDIQVIDSGQKRHPDRICDYETRIWATDTTEVNYKSCLRQIINRADPDLIILTGDQVYGEFDDNGSVLCDFVDFMDSFGIPWAPVMGNHDAETHLGVDWQCARYENAKHCLFKQRRLSGNGNYTVAIVDDDSPLRIFFMMDTNCYWNMSEQTAANGHSISRRIGFEPDQIGWYKSEIKRIRESYPKVKLSMAFHIQMRVFADAYAKYGYDNPLGEKGILQEPINLGLGADGGDFGYLGRHPYGIWDEDYAVWNSFRELGVDSVFVGHEHCNSLSVVYEGVRLQYGQKSSCYDRINREDDGTPIIGGTLIPLNEKGEITSPRILLYTG